MAAFTRTDSPLQPDSIRKDWNSGKYEKALTELTTLLEQLSIDKPQWKATCEEARQKHREWKADRLKSQLAGKAPSRELLKEIGTWVLTILDRLEKGKAPPRRKRPGKSRPRDSSIKRTFEQLIDRFRRPSNIPSDSIPSHRMEDPMEEMEPLPPPVPTMEPEEAMEGSEPPANQTETDGYSFSPHAEMDHTSDWVDVSVYAHEHVAAGHQCLVSVFAHLAAQAEEVRQMMKEADPESVRQGGRTLATPVSRQTPIQFQLQIKDWKIEEPVQSVIWMGRPTSSDFIVTVPDDADRSVIGKVIVFTDRGPVGTIAFNLTVGKATSDLPRPAETQARLFRSSYLSYEAADKATVEALHPKLTASGWEWNPTVPGPVTVNDTWKRSAVEGIEKSELFVLFWSGEAEKSERVETEWQLAFRARFTDTDGLPDMIGVNVSESAPPPPDALSFLPFLSNFEASPPDLPEVPSFSEDKDTLKRLAGKYTSEGDQRVFEILMSQAKPEDLNDIVLLQSQLLSLQTREQFGHISKDLAASERGRINLSILDLVGRLL